MKTIIYLLCFLIGFMFSCQKELNATESNTESVVGEWAFAYKMKTQMQNGSWSEWAQINTLVAVPSLSFTEKGKILYNGKPANTCCNYLTYKQEGTTIKLLEATNTPDCILTSCAACGDWKIKAINAETLELEQCGVINLYNKLK
jgi:hypothetical protein